MNKSKGLLSVLIIILCVSTMVSAQDNTALISQIENSIREREPGWRLDKTQISKNHKYIYYKWKSGKSSVTALLLIHTSSEELARNFNVLADDLEIHGLKMRVLRNNIQNLGDENYLWEGYYNKKLTGVYFRKGRHMLNVSAPSVELSERFARHIAEVLPAN